MLLERDHRTIFCRWLENEIYSTGGLVEQMQKIRTPEAIIKRMQLQKAGCEIVLRMLQVTEEVSIGGDRTRPGAGDGDTKRD